MENEGAVLRGKWWECSWKRWKFFVARDYYMYGFAKGEKGRKKEKESERWKVEPEQRFYAPRSRRGKIYLHETCGGRPCGSHAIRGNIVAALNAPLLIKLYIRASVPTNKFPATDAWSLPGRIVPGHADVLANNLRVSRAVGFFCGARRSMGVQEAVGKGR